MTITTYTAWVFWDVEKDTKLGELSTIFTKLQQERKEKYVNDTYERCQLNEQVQAPCVIKTCKNS